MNMLVKRKAVVQKAKDLRYKETDVKYTTVEYPDLFVCKSCKKPIEKEELKSNHNLCPACGAHFYISPYDRLDLCFDQYERIEFSQHVDNPINFPGYADKKQLAKERSGLDEAIVIAKAKIKDLETYVFVMDKEFMMASMGIEVGERICRCFEMAQEEGLPVVGFCASGGARMQEGIYSLMQMANTSFAIKDFSDAGGFFLAVLTNPTTGGVLASFASLADMTIAEPFATIGFTGRRVIEQTIKEKLADDFQTSEFQLAHGFLDEIVSRQDLHDYIEKALAYHR
ncbi:acetyl-CoA carboxylase carboxyl transferase subunit beta [Atopobacter sp. AH10]|uniref:acetyl-CoA carboxylase carboxyltransferase subunit beta n=1 Tax=Atopobacter sp. AH10 TaxID=2315861 RepID=UPI000EF24122|nr:acetyl-CoA carboxylase carboxyltransferase subunit beta [Atopobacter sp. AH10]RLK63052.1 acetyl-CoA carboxylase carboxyl transferase subunit beta [Atopobacter sp. AH10]